MLSFASVVESVYCLIPQKTSPPELFVFVLKRSSLVKESTMDRSSAPFCISPRRFDVGNGPAGRPTGSHVDRANDGPEANLSAEKKAVLVNEHVENVKDRVLL